MAATSIQSKSGRHFSALDCSLPRCQAIIICLTFLFKVTLLISKVACDILEAGVS